MNDFPTNHAASPSQSPMPISPRFSQMPTRHPTMSFPDGTLCLLDVNRTYYFSVHKGLLCRHSAPLLQAIDGLQEKVKTSTAKDDLWSIEGNLVLEMDDEQEDLATFLSALYDGVSNLKYDNTDFPAVSSVLRLATKYQVEHIRCDILRGLSVIWPKTLLGWEYRESDATDSQGNYKPRSCYPHPILLINLARKTNCPDLLPSAFYDLSRCSPYEIASGYLATGLTGLTEHHVLSDSDLLRALKGREYASRFLTWFITTELEPRTPSANCLNLISPPGGNATADPCRSRICKATFEATSFEILRDVNGVVFNRSCDPLFAMMDADSMLGNQQGPGVSGSPNGQATGGRLGSLQGACEPCKMEFATAVDSAREELWHRLPVWFGIEVADWP